MLKLTASIFAILMLTAGCATTPDARQSLAELTPAMLISGPEPGTHVETAYATADVLELDAAMRAFLDEAVNLKVPAPVRLDQLIDALIHGDQFRIAYDNRTQTASETFASGYGNCLSFTSMFVAMARAVNLKASFQEVEIPPDWLFQDGTFVLNRHVNVNVNLGKAGDHVIDFNMDDFRSTYDRRVVSDERALAHFFNNEGVEAMQQRDTELALANLRQSLRLDPSFAPAWNNLGTLYRRQERLDYAEASYLQALEVSRHEYVAMSNLTSLYAETGDEARMAEYEQRTARHRQRNPYYRYELARAAFAANDYQQAIDHLKFAARKKPLEPGFYVLMSASYQRLGEDDKARRSLEKAESITRDDAVERSYQSKIDLLLSDQAAN